MSTALQKRRRRRARRTGPLRLLSWGAAAGLVASLIALVAVPGIEDGTTGSLVRLAIVTPPALYVVWWLVFPGIRPEEEPAPVAERPAADPQLLTSIFDAPKAARHEDFQKARPRIREGIASDQQLRTSVRPSAGTAPAHLRPSFRRNAG